MSYRASRRRRCLQIIVHDELKQLVAVMTERAAERASPPPRFRLLTTAETEAIVGAQLLAELARSASTPA